MTEYFSDEDLQPPAKTVSIMSIAESIMQEYGIEPGNRGEHDTFKPMTEILSMDKLHVEQASQRNKNVPHIMNIFRAFHPKSAQLPLVIRRTYDNGKLVLPDGQQRAIAMAMKGYKKIKCIVIETNSLLEESDIFLKVNSNRKAVPTPVTHRNKVMHHLPKSLLLERTIRQARFRIDEKEGNRTIKGITRCARTGDTYGYPILGRALETFDEIWPEHTKVHLYLLSGLSMLLFTYLDPASPTYSVESVQDVDPHLMGSRIRKRYPTAQDAADYVARENVALVRNGQHWRTGGRPNDTFRLENDLHYARSFTVAFNIGRRRAGVEPLDMERVWQSYQFKKGLIKKNDESKSNRNQKVIGILTHNPA